MNQQHEYERRINRLRSALSWTLTCFDRARHGTPHAPKANLELDGTPRDWLREAEVRIKDALEFDSDIRAKTAP